jgi:hypothetical protein
MEFTGDEKRIRALFSELALQDQNAAPTFAELWVNAASKKSAPVRGFSKLLLAITAALLIVAASWTAWSWYRSTATSHEQLVNVSPQSPSPQLPQQTEHVATLDTSPKYRPNRPNKRRPHQPERSAINEAALLSRWQSPTQSFLQSPTAVNFNSLPQLNQSLNELKQFLPRNTELTKESNQ